MSIFTDNVATWLGATIVALLTAFSDRILGRIWFCLNRADLRIKYFEELAVDLSSYLSYAEIFEERYRRGWDDKNDLDAVAGDANAAISTLRKKKYVYRSWARKYWGTHAARGLSDVLGSIRRLDDAVHAFNDKGNIEGKLRTGRYGRPRVLRLNQP